MAEKWNVSGVYFETCNCAVTCPCVYGSNTTDGNCTVLVGWHIEKGLFGDAVLDGFNVAMAIYSPGEMAEGKFQAALYLDEKASDAQKDGLTKIFLGQAGGEYSMVGLMSAVEKVLGVTSKKIDYHANGKKRSLEIGGVSKAEIEAIEGQGGAEVTITNLPVFEGETVVQAKSKQFSFHDYGLNWEISGKNGYYSKFSYQPG